jgi:hypothetical protein
VLQRYNPYLTGIGFEPWLDFKSSLQVVADKPLVFLKAAWLNYYTKFMDLYFNQQYGAFDPIFLVRKPPTDYFLAMWFYAYLITAVGFASLFIRNFRNRIKDRAIAWLVFLIIAYKTAFHLFTIAVWRYRAPIEPFLIMFAAYGLYIFIEFTRNKTTVLPASNS